MALKLRFSIVVGLLFAVVDAFAQAPAAPAIAYNSPQKYQLSGTIASLSPRNTGGAIPALVIKVIGSGFDVPTGVAIAAAGDIYVAEYWNNDVKKIEPNGAIVVLGSGFTHPYGVAVDASGNVYVTDYGK